MAGVGLQSTLSPVNLHSTTVCTQEIMLILFLELCITIYCALFAHVLCMHDEPRDHAQSIGPIATYLGKVNG